MLFARWDANDFELSWKLVTAITDNTDIKNGLFPRPGANASTANGGGKRKTDHLYEVACEVFADHPTHSEAFAATITPAQKCVWTTKTKNKLAQ